MTARSVGPAVRMAGAYMRNVQAQLTTPSPGAENTSSTVTTQGRILDPLRRSGGLVFQVDRGGLFDSPEAQTSSTVTGVGWADTPLSWVSTAIGNGTWFYRSRSSGVKVGAGPTVPAGRYSAPVSFWQSGGAGITRTLYTYVNRGIESRIPEARALYVYVNRAVTVVLLGRALYLYVNRMFIAAVAARALYLYLNRRDGEVFPYLNHISPTEQYEGGQVDLYGDGFGQYLDAVPTATITVSSTNASYIAANVRDGTAAEWRSNDGASSWIRFTWGAAKRIVAVVLEGARNPPTAWGRPRFRFDDASTQDGAVDVPLGDAGSTVAEYPVGGGRMAYWLVTPKVSTYVEVQVISGSGAFTNRGFAEVWILEEAVTPDTAELSRAWLNLDLPSEQDMGIVAWQNRSPNWYPANSGIAPLAAATVTIPVGAESGLVIVQEEV